MSLLHSKVSGKADGGDATLVQPSDWNANHIVDSTGLTAIATSASVEPSNPSTGRGLFYNKVACGRSVPKYRDELGVDIEFQPSFAQEKIRGMLIGVGNTTPAITYWGLSAYSFASTGTATTRTPAVTNFFTRCARLGIVSTATAGSFAGVRSTDTLITIGNGSGLGGFRRVIRFGCSDAATVSGARQFVGLRNSIAVPSNVDPATLTNIIGVGHDAADTNLKIYYGGSSAQTPIDLGANFPANTLSVDAYELILVAPSSSNNTVYYQVRRLNTGDVASGTLTGTAGVALPASTAYLNHLWAWRCNNATALAVGLDIFLDYLETDF